VLASVSKHLDRSGFAKTSKNQSKNVLFFLGEPGVGKTYMAHKIAKSLELPLFKISLSDINTTQALIGSKAGDLPDKQLSIISSLLLSCGDQPCPKNAVFFIDEVDKTFNSPHTPGEMKNQLLKFVDPEDKEFVLSDLSTPKREIVIDTSGYLFILAGNNSLSDSTGASPMKDRYTTINFEGMGRDSKFNIIFNSLKDHFEDLHLGNYEAHRLLVEQMVDYDLKEKKNPGLRPLLKTIENYAYYLNDKKGSDEGFDFKQMLDEESQGYERR
jgi:ATP-dependent Lon protease